MAFLDPTVLLVFFPAAEPVSPVSYRCLDGTEFTLQASETMATVRFADGEYRLPRRSSALAIKYSTETAVLYLDGEFAAFVADDRPLPGCARVRDARRR